MISFLNAALFAGFLAVAIPPIVHLFSRKKYDEVDWAAMQFLRVSPKTRRKVFFEQFLLMLLRMAAVGLIALALSAPAVTSSLFNRLGGGRGERDVVVLVDGSASMAYRHAGRTGTDAAKAWAAEFIDRLAPGDRVAVFQAREQAVPLLGSLSADREQAKNALELVTPAKGGVDWPGCVQAAFALLATGRPDRDVVVLTDGQRYGWADENAAAKWELVGRPGDRPDDPRVWVVNVAPDRPADPANNSLDPITAGRAVAAAGREVRFKSAVRSAGAGERPKVGKVRLEVDGRGVGEVPVPAAPADAGVVPLTFAHRFTAGSHLVTLQMDPDDLPGDDRQDFALEVLPAVPVLIVDGDPAPGPRARGGDFLRDALAPTKDPTPSFAVRVVSVADFSPALFAADVKGPGTPPRVVVFANVAKFTREQSDAVEKYLTDGGSVLVAAGDRCDAAAYNRVAFRAGQGWLPARLVDVVGSAESLADAPRPQPASFTHPMTEVFKDPLPGGLHTAYFPRRWKLDTTAGVNGATGSAVTVLTTGDPLLVERGVGRGRALLAAVPLDNTWRTNFHTLPDFVRFAHEAVYYLAGARAAERNLAPGQPIIFTPRPDEPPAGVTVQPPDAAAKLVPAKRWPLVYPGTREPGAYKLGTAGGRSFYYAVRSDPLESVLTPAGDDDRKKVADVVKKLEYVTRPDEIEARRGAGPQTREVWWVLLVLVMALLAGEIFYTRKLSQRGMPADAPELAVAAEPAPPRPREPGRAPVPDRPAKATRRSSR